MSQTKPKKRQARRKKPVESTTREVLYSKITAKVCNNGSSMTREQAQKLIGWEMENEKMGKWGANFDLKDSNGAKVKLNNNVKNRPLYLSNVASLKQELLRGKWRFNGEPIIIGKTGLILNGQHTLIAFILACQDWDLDPDAYPEWSEEPTLQKLVVFGVDEDDQVVNTMDTCKPRSLQDVIYRSAYFKSFKPNDRRNVARVCAYCINTLWSRLGLANAFAPKQTHSESLDFLNKHPRVLESVNHIVVEDGGEKTISKYISPGYAAGMLYLMGVSKSDPTTYLIEPTEKALDFSNWEKAEEFFTLIGGQAKEMKPLTEAFAKLLSEEDGGSRIEKIALIAKAWEQWFAQGKLSNLGLKYVTKDGVKRLAEEPSVGGIDLLNPAETDE